MGIPWKTTPTIRAAIIHAYAEGLPLKVIAFKFNIHQAYATFLARKAGYPPRRNHPGKPRRCPPLPSTNRSKRSRSTSTNPTTVP